MFSAEKRQQVFALGRLGWPLRRIEDATGVRRETAGDLHKPGIVLRAARQLEREVAGKSGHSADHGSDEPSSEEKAKPATNVVITCFSAQNSSPANSVDASARARATYREKIDADLRRGRNAIGI